MKHVLFIIRTAPYGSAAIPESVRSCLGFGTMPLRVSYLLMDDAAWVAIPTQDPTGIGGTSALQLVQNLADLDVELWIEAEALQERGLTVEGLEPPLKPLLRDQVSDLIAQADVVMTY